jgi:hypothetical protein
MENLIINMLKISEFLSVNEKFILADAVDRTLASLLKFAKIPYSEVERNYLSRLEALISRYEKPFRDIRDKLASERSWLQGRQKMGSGGKSMDDLLERLLTAVNYIYNAALNKKVGLESKWGDSMKDDVEDWIKKFISGKSTDEPKASPSANSVANIDPAVISNIIAFVHCWIDPNMNPKLRAIGKLDDQSRKKLNIDMMTAKYQIPDRVSKILGVSEVSLSSSLVKMLNQSLVNKLVDAMMRFNTKHRSIEEIVDDLNKAEVPTEAKNLYYVFRSVLYGTGKSSSNAQSPDIIVLGEKITWKEKEEPTFIRNLPPGERVKRLKEIQRGISPEQLAKREKEEKEHAKKVREEAEAEDNAKSTTTTKKVIQPELPLSNGSDASHRLRLVTAKRQKIKGKIPKGLAGYWKNHFKGRPKGSFSEAVKILRKHDIENPEALAAYLEHESTSPKKWPAED